MHLSADTVSASGVRMLLQRLQRLSCRHIAREDRDDKVPLLLAIPSAGNISVKNWASVFPFSTVVLGAYDNKLQP